MGSGGFNEDNFLKQKVMKHILLSQLEFFKKLTVFLKKIAALLLYER